MQFFLHFADHTGIHAGTSLLFAASNPARIVVLFGRPFIDLPPCQIPDLLKSTFARVLLDASATVSSVRRCGRL